MLRHLASGGHAVPVGSEEDLSCLHLYLSGLLGKLLRLRDQRDEAEPEEAASDLDMEPVRLGPGCEERLGVGCCVLAGPWRPRPKFDEIGQGSVRQDTGPVVPCHRSQAVAAP